MTARGLTTKNEFCAAMTLYAIIIGFWPIYVFHAIGEYRWGGMAAVRKWWKGEVDVGQFVHVARRVRYSRGRFCVVS